LAAGFKSLELKTFGEWPADIIDQLTDGFIPYNVALEDYSGYCPRKYRLIRNAIICDDPTGTKECSVCIAELGPLVYGYRGMTPWQERTRRILSKANKIDAITDEICHAYIRRFPIPGKLIIKHETSLNPQPSSLLSIKSKEPLRIAVLSARSLDEGYLQLIEQANKALKQKLAVEFIVLGATLNDARLQQLPNIHLTGAVSQTQIQHVLHLYDCCAIADFSPCAHRRIQVAKTAQHLNLPLVQDCIAA
jgi:hypothetical protein